MIGPMNSAGEMIIALTYGSSIEPATRGRVGPEATGSREFRRWSGGPGTRPRERWRPGRGRIRARVARGRSPCGGDRESPGGSQTPALGCVSGSYWSEASLRVSLSSASRSRSKSSPSVGKRPEIHHRLRLGVAGERRRLADLRASSDGVAHLDPADLLDPRDQIADFARDRGRQPRESPWE